MELLLFLLVEKEKNAIASARSSSNDFKSFRGLSKQKSVFELRLIFILNRQRRHTMVASQRWKLRDTVHAIKHWHRPHHRLVTQQKCLGDACSNMLCYKWSYFLNERSRAKSMLVNIPGGGAPQYKWQHKRKSTELGKRARSLMIMLRKPWHIYAQPKAPLLEISAFAEKNCKFRTDDDTATFTFLFCKSCKAAENCRLFRQVKNRFDKLLTTNPKILF